LGLVWETVRTQGQAPGLHELPLAAPARPAPPARRAAAAPPARKLATPRPALPPDPGFIDLALDASAAAGTARWEGEAEAAPPATLPVLDDVVDLAAAAAEFTVAARLRALDAAEPEAAGAAAYAAGVHATGAHAAGAYEPAAYAPEPGPADGVHDELGDGLDDAIDPDAAPLPLPAPPRVPTQLHALPAASTADEPEPAYAEAEPAADAPPRNAQRTRLQRMKERGLFKNDG
jgi:hypothetical protein